MLNKAAIIWSKIRVKNVEWNIILIKIICFLFFDIFKM